MNQPNIIYLHSHDTGRYLQPYGYALDTPNIQRLAEQGMLFRQAFATAPTCSPSRAGLLTGQSPHNAGMLGLRHRGFELRDRRRHLAYTLCAAGYHTAQLGMQHVTDDPKTVGYDHVVPTPTNRAEHVGAATVRFLENTPDQPFFLAVGFSETHRPFPEPTTEIAAEARYNRPPEPLPDTAQTRLDMATYHAAVRDYDKAVGRILDCIDRQGLAENTLVILTTDHGPAFPLMKCNLTRHGLGVALIMRGPDGFTGGRICDSLISHIDVFPTLCELLDIDRPAHLQGASMLPLIRGRSNHIREELFGEVTYHASFEPQRSVRTTRYSYIRRFGDRRKPTLPNIDDSISKTMMVDAGLAERTLPIDTLHDLVFDPGEAANVADNPDYAHILDDMRRRLDRWMHDTDDPLLTDPQPIPGPIQVTDPDTFSPNGPNTRPITLRPPTA